MFKTVADQYVGQISLFKVLSGTIRNDDHLVEAAIGTDERLHGLFHLRGSEHMDASRLVAGDIGGVVEARLGGDRQHARAEGQAGARATRPAAGRRISAWR